MDSPEAPAFLPVATYQGAALILAITAALLATWWLAECFRPKARRWERLGPLLGAALATLLTVLAYFRWRLHPNWAAVSP